MSIIPSRTGEKKLSTHRTSFPLLRSRSQRCEPRNPAPPVTRMRFVIDSPLTRQHNHRGGLYILARLDQGLQSSFPLAQSPRRRRNGELNARQGLYTKGFAG